MPKYFVQHLNGEPQIPRPPVEPLGALRPARRPPLVSALRAQDRVIGLTRRILLSHSAGNVAEWLVPTSSVLSDPSPPATHPDSVTERVIARGMFELTPGATLRLDALVGLSNLTAVPGDAGGHAYTGTGPNGAIVVSCTWTDSTGSSVSTENFVGLPNSPFLNGAATPGDEGDQWTFLRVVSIPKIAPEALTTPAAINRWSLGTTVEIVVSHTGSPRVIDLSISETPNSVAFEADDDGWVSHMLGSQTPDGAGPVIEYPYSRMSETTPDGDRRGGTWQVMDVAREQSLRLGPALICWGSYSEVTGDINDTECAERIDVSSTTFVGIPNTGITSYNSANQGWLLGGGANARPYKHNHALAVGYDAVIPVRVRVYCSGSIADTSTSAGVFRIQSSDYSYIDVAIPAGTSWGWQTAYGYLRCGQGPGDPCVAQAFMRRTGGSGGVSVRYFDVYRSGNFGTAV